MLQTLPVSKLLFVSATNGPASKELIEPLIKKLYTSYKHLSLKSTTFEYTIKWLFFDGNRTMNEKY